MRGFTLTGSFYDNVIILSNKGVPLSTVSNRKANWYLKKNLGVETDPPTGYPRAVKLNFTADVEEPRFLHDLSICKDQCVLCGTDKELTLHHVVPYVIRKHFPYQHKARARQWCVLMCYAHHMEIETDLKKLYYHDHGFPHTQKFINRNITLQKIKTSGNIYRVPRQKLESLLAESDYKSVDEIPPFSKEVLHERRRQCSVLHNNEIREWALKFIEEHGGIEGTKTFFREHFLSYHPQYLPDGWLMEKKLS